MAALEHVGSMEAPHVAQNVELLGDTLHSVWSRNILSSIAEEEED